MAEALITRYKTSVAVGAYTVWSLKYLFASPTSKVHWLDYPSQLVLKDSYHLANGSNSTNWNLFINYKCKRKTQSRRVESEKEDGRSLEWDKRVLIVLEKRKKLSLSSSPFQPMQHRLMDSFKLTYVTKGKLITHNQGAKRLRYNFFTQAT